MRRVWHGVWKALKLFDKEEDTLRDNFIGDDTLSCISPVAATIKFGKMIVSEGRAIAPNTNISQLPPTDAVIWARLCIMYLPFAGVSILLIPFSFNFVDALCVAIVLGFICTVSNKIISRGMLAASSKVAVTGTEERLSSEMNLHNKTRRVTSRSLSGTNRLIPIDDGNLITHTSVSKLESGDISTSPSIPFKTPGLKGAFKHVGRHKSLPSMPVSCAATSLRGKEEAGAFEAEEEGKRQPFSLRPGRLSIQAPRQPRSQAGEMSDDDSTSKSSKVKSIPSKSSSKRSLLWRIRRVKVGTRSRLKSTESVKTIGSHCETPHEAESVNVHWKLALVATVELVLKVVNDQGQK